MYVFQITERRLKDFIHQKVDTMPAGHAGVDDDI